MVYLAKILFFLDITIIYYKKFIKPKHNYSGGKIIDKINKINLCHITHNHFKNLAD